MILWSENPHYLRPIIYFYTASRPNNELKTENCQLQSDRDVDRLKPNVEGLLAWTIVKWSWFIEAVFKDFQFAYWFSRSTFFWFTEPWRSVDRTFLSECLSKTYCTMWAYAKKWPNLKRWFNIQNKTGEYNKIIVCTIFLTKAKLQLLQPMK